MTYEQRRAQVLALRAEGLTHREVAERLGISRSHVAHVASERTYATILRTQRLAKQRLRGTCVDCGVETRYNGHGHKVSERCLPCATAFSGKARRGTGTTQTRILAFIGAGERHYIEIVDGCQITNNVASSTLDRMRKLGLLERPRRGVYRKASA